MHGEFKDVADFNQKMKGIKYPPSLAEQAFSGKSIAECFSLPVQKNPREKLLPPGFIDEIRGCTGCDLRANCKAPVPPRFGKNNIMLVGEAPGWSEDKRGLPFVGKSGQLLMDLLDDQGITRDDLTITNATSCYPNGVPEYDDKTCSWAQKTIDHLRPPLVLAVGKRAWHKLSGGKEAIGKVNGTIRDINGTKIMACIHPSAVLRDMDLLPEIGRTIRKFAKLYRILVPIKKKKEEISEIPEKV
jgi:DNA polymerase